MHNMVGESFDMSHEPHGSQAHGRIPYFVCLGPFWAMLGHFGPCWARVGTILGLSWAILGYVGTFWAMLDPCWDHIGLVLSHFGLCWDILGHVGPMLGSSWAILGHIRICVGLCFGLGHFSVVDFSSMQACAKNTKNRKNTICGLRC